MTLKLVIAEDQDDLAAKGAELLEARIRSVLLEKVRFVLALSGGKTPWGMLRRLSRAELPWNRLDVVQVDERIAPDGHEARNLVGLEDALPDVPVRIFSMPVTDDDLAAAAHRYQLKLVALGGIDLVHLGIGDDGHTASLVPGDTALDSRDLVAVTGEYRGFRRMTLTFSAIAAARSVLFLAAGADKKAHVARVLGRDGSIPAGRVHNQIGWVLVDRAAAPDATPGTPLP